MTDSKHKTVCVMGMGYVGLTLSVVLAEEGYPVVGVEANADLAADLSRGKPHFYEENLELRLQGVLASEMLSIVDTIADNRFDVYMICVATPVDKKTKKAFLGYIEKVVVDVGKVLNPGNLVCMRSTVPVGITRKMVLPMLEKESELVGGRDFSLVFAPERTMEGRALTELRENTQIVGGVTYECVETASRMFHRLTSTIVRVSSLEAAELIKIMDNTYRDVRFAYANEMAVVAEHLGVDIHEIIKAANVHYPRNNIPFPSPGVGGACLSKDPYILAEFSGAAGYIPELVLKAREINEVIPKKIAERIDCALHENGKSSKDATFFIAGFSFKGDPPTADLRQSTTIWLLEELRKNGAKKIRGYDALVENKELESLGVIPSEYPAGIRNADVLIVANNHQEFKFWNIRENAKEMRHPAIIYDAWRMLSQADTISGITYMGPGV